MSVDGNINEPLSRSCDDNNEVADLSLLLEMPGTSSAQALPIRTDVNSDLSQPISMGRLANIGSTCYLNAALYSLRFIPDFTHNLHHIRENIRVFFEENLSRVCSSADKCKHSQGIKTLASNCTRWIDKSAIEDVKNITYAKRRVVDELHWLFYALNTLETNKDESSLKPHPLQRSIQKVDRAFVSNQQHDSHELLMCILNIVRECSIEFSTKWVKNLGEHTM